MRIAQLRQRLRDLGAKPCHEDRLLRGWSQVCSYDRTHSPAEGFFPLALRNELPAIEVELHGLARLRGEYPADDEVARLLVELADGQMVESMLLPRGGLCVSTQVGCAVGCVFCMSGRDGLLRQLGSAEIVAQVVLARRRRAVSKVVFMGMGEPAHNLDNVLEAIQLLGTQGNIGHKNLVLSTVGDVRVFERLMNPECSSGSNPLQLPLIRGRAESAPPLTRGGWEGLGREKQPSIPAVKPALAISLHTTDATLRARLLPHAPQIAIEELVERAEVYARATGYPKEMGVRTAVGLMFKQRFAKARHVTTSNWSQPQLTPQQMLYAANDAYAALKVLEALNLRREDLPIMGVATVNEAVSDNSL